MPVETLRVTPELTLRAPNGAAVVLREVRARLANEGEQLSEVWLIAEVDAATWSAIDHAGWFHLDPDVRGPSFGGPIASGGTVQLEARLARDQVTTLALLAESEWDVLAQILGARLVPALHDTESWYALHVTRQQGPLRVGFRTTWADAREVPPIPHRG